MKLIARSRVTEVWQHPEAIRENTDCRPNPNAARHLSGVQKGVTMKLKPGCEPAFPYTSEQLEKGATGINIRLHVAAQIAAGLTANAGCDKHSYETISQLSLAQADDLIQRELETREDKDND